MAQPVSRVHIYPTAEIMARAAAAKIVDLIVKSVVQSGRFNLALSGGTTPQIFYQMLAGEFTDVIPWDKVNLYWGDERYVSPRDTRSNFHSFHESLLRYVHVPLGNIHPMPTHRADPADAARDYENFLRAEFEGDWPRFDVVLLGMGADGHTASIFPGSPAVDTDRWVMAVDAKAEPATRLTLTLPVLNAAANICFLVSGEDKAGVLRQVLMDPPDLDARPASGVRPSDGELIWCVDEEAAAELEGIERDGVAIERCGDASGAPE